jgi:hypothetical protein
MRRISIVLFVIILMTFTTAAQEADCAVIYLQYADLMAENPNDLQAVAQLQAWRRTLESEDSAPCEETAYRALVTALNLSADSIISDQLGNDEDSAAFRAEADTQAAVAARELAIDTDGVIVDDELPIIESPTNDQVMPNHQATVRGTYNPDIYGADKDMQLWVFVVPLSQMYYPQILAGCEPERRNSLSYRPNGTWTSGAFLGTEEAGAGEPFEILLMAGDTDASNAVYDTFENIWCPNEDFPGLTADEVFAMGFEPIQSVFVTRAS